MKSNKAKLRDASRKAWRTKKRMEQARKEQAEKTEQPQLASAHEQHSAWPPYMKRALPLPDIC